MASTGPKWSLYPLLAIVAFFEFLLGATHIAYCSPLFFLFFPFINAVFGLVAAFHAIFLRYPNRFVDADSIPFTLQSSFEGLNIVVLLSILINTRNEHFPQVLNRIEARAASRPIEYFDSFSREPVLCEVFGVNGSIVLLEYEDETIKDGVCHGLKYRTIAMVGSCNDLLGTFQLSILNKLGWEPKERESIRFLTSIALSVLSGIHLLICTLLTFYSAIETKIRLYSYHYQVAISLFVIFVSFLHLRYCCTFFFLYLPLAIGLFSLLQGIVSWRTKCHGSTTRALNIFGAAFAVLLNAATSFGIFCWFNRNTVPHMITRHCHWLEHREAYYYRTHLPVHLLVYPVCLLNAIRILDKE
uniref:Uncharacterized protein n=2 Tax=Caenorhabditis japonica TaxID=281687 RepID=A0A8R1HH29_CAEJA